MQNSLRNKDELKESSSIITFILIKDFKSDTLIMRVYLSRLTCLNSSLWINLKNDLKYWRSLVILSLQQKKTKLKPKMSQSCIKSCSDCATTCFSCAEACIKEQMDCWKICLECAEVCQLCAKILSLKGTHSHLICEVI